MKQPTAQNAKTPPTALNFPSLLLFCALAVTSLLFWRGPLAATLSLARHDEQYTHILLIVPIAIALVVLDWKSQDSIFRPSLGMGSLMLLAVLADIAAPKISQLPDVQLSVRMLAFVLWSISAFTLCFGARAFRQASFPLLFLLWTVPFPDFVVNAIVSGLQQSSALAAHAIFVLARVPVEQRGLLIHIPDLTLEVAPECSSIRSSLVLVVTTMVLAHLLLRTAWRKLLLIALAIPVAIAKNGLRIFVLGYLAIRVDRTYLAGRLHHQGGFIFFLIALAAVFLLLWILRRGETKEPGTESQIPA
jgi:exosortase